MTERCGFHCAACLIAPYIDNTILSSQKDFIFDMKSTVQRSSAPLTFTMQPFAFGVGRFSFFVA